MSQLDIIRSPVEKLLIVKAKDKKWKNFPQTIFPATTDFDFIENFKCREDDIFIAGFPRSGTSRLQEMVWIIANDFNFEKALEIDSDARCPYFGMPDFAFKYRKNPIANSLDEMPSPRMAKTHLPVQLLPPDLWIKKPRIIFISRDVKDVVVSNYHIFFQTAGFDMRIEDYFELFLNDQAIFSPYREYQQNFFDLPDYDNIFYLSYEAMSADIDGTIKNIAKFLGKTVSIENRKKLKEHLKFENMQKNVKITNEEAFKEMANAGMIKGKNDIKFVRKGVVGGYKSEMSQEYIDRFNKWIAERDILNQGFAYKEVEDEANKRMSVHDLINKFQL